MTIPELLVAPQSPENGRALVAWANDLRGRILRGDMMIGILSADEVVLAPTALRRASECGIKEALLDLGNWLAMPPIGEPDLVGARAAFRQAIIAGAEHAKLHFVEFVWFHCRETATAEEQAEVFQMALDVANHGDSGGRATYLLGLLTCDGFGTQADPNRADELQLEATSKGNTDALFELYLYREMGIGVQKDSKAAMEFLQRAAAEGHSRAMYNLGAYLATGRGLPKDLAKAAEWYLMASKAGNVYATANLALMYAQGEGVEKDLEQAKMLFDEAEYMGLDVTDGRASVGL
jgi:TPR repeat protein